MRDMNVHVIHMTKYSAAIGSRQTNSSSFHPRSVDPSDSISECSVVAIPFAVAIPFGNRVYCIVYCVYCIVYRIERKVCY